MATNHPTFNDGLQYFPRESKLSQPPQGTVTASVTGGGGGGAIIISASNSSYLSNQFTFSNAHGISFGISNAVITASANFSQSSQPIYYSAQGGQSSANTLIFGNLNGFTFSNSNGSIVGSYSQAGASSLSIGAGGSTLGSVSQMVFSNMHGVTFGASTSNNGSITITASINALSSQSAQAASAGNGSFAFQTLKFADSNGVSFSTGTQGIYASVNAAAQTNQTIGVYAVSNTTQSSSGTLDARSMSLQGAGIVSVGYTNGSVVISANAGTAAADGVNIIAAGTQTANTTGTVMFSNANGIAFGMSNSSVITASYTVPTVTNSSLTISAGTHSATASNIVFSNANGIGFGLTGNTITASYTVPTVTNSSWTVSDSNTSGTVGRLAFTNLNGVTLSLSSGTGGLHTIVGSHNGLTSQSNQALSGSNGSFTFQTATFGNLNGVSFYTTNGSMVASYTVPSTAGLISAVNISAGTTSNNLSALTFADSNNITFGLDGSTITASVPAISSLSATGAVSISVNGSTISIGAPVQSNQTLGIYASSNTTLTSSGTIDARSLSFRGAGNIYVGYSSGEVLISATGGGAAGTAISGVALSDTTYTSGTISFRDGNGISWASTTGQGISITHGLQFTSNTSAITSNAVNTSAARIQGIIGSNTTYTSGSVGFRDLNGISWQSTTGQSFQITHDLQYTSNTSAITSNALNTSASRVINIIAATNTTGGGTASLSSNVSFTNANNFTFYTSAGNAIAASFSQSVDTGKAGTGFTSAGANISFSGTLNTNGLSLSGSVAAQSNQSAIKGFGVSNTGQTAGNTGISTGVDWVLAGSGSITMSQSTAGGGPNTVWVQHPAWITTQSGQAFSAGAASSAFQTLSFQDSNGVSFSNNAGAIRVTHDLQFTSATSAITSNALNTSVARIQGIIGSNTTYTSGSVGLRDLNGITWQSTTGQSFQITHDLQYTSATSAITSNALHSSASRVFNIVAATNSTGGGTASLSSNVSFSNVNGVSFYTSAGGAVVGSVVTSYRASNDAVGLNTAKTNATWTVNSSGISFDGGGYAGTGFTSGGTNISMSGTLNTAGLSLSLSVAPPGAAAENNWHNLLGANTSGNTTASGSTIGLSGINLTLSGTNNSVINISAPATSSLSATGAVSISTNGSTIFVGAPQMATLSRFEYPSDAVGGISTIGQGSLSINRVYVPCNVTAGSGMIVGSMSAAAAASTGTQGISLWMGIYTLNGSTLSLATSGSQAHTFQVSSNTAMSSNYIGVRQLSVPMTVNMTPGVYWVGAVISTNTTGTACGLVLSIFGQSLISASGAAAPIGVNTSAGRALFQMQGIYTAATSAGPASIGTSAVNMTSASNIQRANFYFQLANATY